MSNILYSWNFNSKKQRGKMWYIITFAIAIGLIIWGFLSKQYGMSIVIIILIGFIFYIENNSNDIINVKITEDGIGVLDSFYPYSKIKYYSIIYSGENAIILRLKVQKKIGAVNIDIEINNEIANNIKNILAGFLQENKDEELNSLEKLTRILKI